MPPDKKTSWGKRERYSFGYDILVVSALDRLGRDLWSAMEYTKKLLRMGIRIISVNDNTEITERDFEEMDNFIKSICE